MEWIKKYTYDVNKNVIRVDYSNQKDKSKRIDEFVYKYDTYGNIIEIIYSENGIPKYAKVYDLLYK
jgi:hypothetical protein